MSDARWIFPDNGYGTDVGLNNADLEAFKKNRISGLAREIVQNSIDAKLDGADFVKVEFREFEINKNDVPGINSIEEKLSAAYEWRSKTGDKTAADKIRKELECIKKPRFKCLRISDFNTIGLRGVSNDDPSSPFHYLVKGSGLSNKGSNSGGSKGVGKNAAFVNSNFETIFYSTCTDRGEKGYIGVSKISSAPLDDSGKMTSGTGFYGRTEKILAIEGLLNLDPNFRRTDYGTDIYIIDFNDEGDWEKEIIPKVLDSFMYAILKGKLIVKVGAYELNHTNIGSFVGPRFLKDTNKILSQYLLLTSGIEPYAINVEDNGVVIGTAKLYFLDCTDEDNRKYGNKKCSMIRYPYMKICDESFPQFTPFTALCVIEDGKLCSMLREVENPQHVDFEFSRLPKEEQPYYKHLYSDALLGKIEKYIESKLAISEDQDIELEGSDEYLSDEMPDMPAPETNSGEHKINANGHISTKKKKAKTPQQNRITVPDKEGESIIVDILGEEDSDEEVLVPEGSNNSGGGPYHVGDKPETGKKEGDSKEGLKIAALRGLNYRFACLDKQKGIYMLRFKADYSREDVDLGIRSIDESYAKEIVPIISADVNGVPVSVDRNRSIKISLVENQDVYIKFVLDQKDYFSAEVVCYEGRK